MDAALSAVEADRQSMSLDIMRCMLSGAMECCVTLVSGTKHHRSENVDPGKNVTEEARYLLDIADRLDLGDENNTVTVVYTDSLCLTKPDTEEINL